MNNLNKGKREEIIFFLLKINNANRKLTRCGNFVAWAAVVKTIWLQIYYYKPKYCGCRLYWNAHINSPLHLTYKAL